MKQNFIRTINIINWIVATVLVVTLFFGIPIWMGVDIIGFKKFIDTMSDFLIVSIWRILIALFILFYYLHKVFNKLHNIAEKNGAFHGCNIWW